MLEFRGGSPDQNVLYADIEYLPSTDVSKASSLSVFFHLQPTRRQVLSIMMALLNWIIIMRRIGKNSMISKNFILFSRSEKRVEPFLNWISPSTADLSNPAIYSEERRRTSKLWCWWSSAAWWSSYPSWNSFLHWLFWVISASEFFRFDF